MVQVPVDGGVQLHLLVEQMQGQEHGGNVGEQGAAGIHLLHRSIEDTAESLGERGGMVVDNGNLIELFKPKPKSRRILRTRVHSNKVVTLFSMLKKVL